MQTSNLQRVETIGQTRWSRVEWFGVVAGASTWMLCTGVFLFKNGGVFAGWLPLSSGLITVIVGVALWKRRDRLAFNTGMIVLLAVTLLTVSITIAGTVRIASAELLAGMRWSTNPIPMIAFLSLVLGGGIWMNYSQLMRSKQHRENAG